MSDRRETTPEERLARVRELGSALKGARGDKRLPKGLRKELKRIVPAVQRAEEKASAKLLGAAKKAKAAAERSRRAEEAARAQAAAKAAKAERAAKTPTPPPVVKTSTPPPVAKAPAPTPPVEAPASAGHRARKRARRSAWS